MEEMRMVFCTFPDVGVARQIGTVLVEKQLAACVNLLPGSESIYRWRGRMEHAHECLAIIKTPARLWDELVRVLCDLHPYEVPEIVALAPAAVESRYLGWVLRVHGEIHDPCEK